MNNYPGLSLKGLACGKCGKVISLFELNSPKTAVGEQPYDSSHKICPYCNAALKVDDALIRWLNDTR